MGVWIAAGLAFLAICAVFVGWLLWRAPVGYEDETGFHYGTPDEPLSGSVESDLQEDSNSYDTQQG